MEETGISITGIVLSGGAVTAIIGLLAAWLKARYARTEIHPQPLKISEEKWPLAREACDERHTTIRDQINELFVRIRVAEITIAELTTLKEQIKSMDSKLDIIINKP